ncbi:MAG: hypothetical protein MUF75_08540 [Bacteroidia bacterium]|jgi:hypothetical protein|nr:hypothetical protein [Bacteroidia bacterium]
MLTKVAKISTLLSAGLVFMGFLKLKFYYQAFGIDILSYVSFSEIITSFLDDLQLIMILTILMLLQSGPLLNLIQRKSGLSIEDFYSGLMKALFPHRLKLVGLFIVLFLLLVTLLSIQWISYNLAVIYLLLFSALQICHYLALYKNETGEIEIRDISLFLSLVLPVALSVYLLAQRDIDKVFSDPVNITIQIEEQTISLGNGYKLKYLGKTDDYFYYYDLEFKVSNVLPLTGLKKITVLTKR